MLALCDDLAVRLGGEVACEMIWWRGKGTCPESTYATVNSDVKGVETAHSTISIHRTMQIYLG